jgi:hypothetical protein
MKAKLQKAGVLLGGVALTAAATTGCAPNLPQATSMEPSGGTVKAIDPDPRTPPNLFQTDEVELRVRVTDENGRGVSLAKVSFKTQPYSWGRIGPKDETALGDAVHTVLTNNDGYATTTFQLYPQAPKDKSFPFEGQAVLAETSVRAGDGTATDRVYFTVAPDGFERLS